MRRKYRSSLKGKTCIDKSTFFFRTGDSKLPRAPKSVGEEADAETTAYPWLAQVF